MASVEKTHPRVFNLAPGIRVRKERFGVLFYNPKGPKLAFLHSGPWIQPEFFSGKIQLMKWIEVQFPGLPEEKTREVERRLLLALAKLAEKGWIVEAMEAV